MNKSKIVTFALMFLLVLIPMFQVEASNSDYSVAYIYSTDLTSAESYESFLTAQGMTVDLVPNSTAETWDYSGYGLIVVGSDAGYMGNWEPEAAVSVIDGTGKPILGLGEGGYAFFGKLSLDIGYPNGAHGQGTAMYVAETGHQIFHSPTEISVPLDNIVQLYTSADIVSIYMPSPVAGVTPLGRLPTSLDRSVLIQEDTRYVLWGFNNSPEDMTQTGKDLFVNTVTWLGLHNPVAAFTFSPTEPQIDETVTFDASDSDAPNGTIVGYAWDFGDGTTPETGVTTTHAYTTAETYTVTLTVTDNNGLTDTDTVVITVEKAAAAFPFWILAPIIGGIIGVAAVLVFLKRRRPKEKVPKPAKLRITAEPKEILADGEEKSVITIELLDKEGKPVSALADTEIKLTSTRGKIEKPLAKIPKGKETEKTVLISSKEAGTVTLSADVKGLKSTSITVTFKEKKRYCMHCGAKIAFTAKRCPECGKTPPAGVDTKTCKNCKEVIPIVAKFCSECGASQPKQER